MLLFIGGTEVILILLVTLLLFGSKKIPELARALGKGYREFQKATDEIKRELNTIESEVKSTKPNDSDSVTPNSPEGTDISTPKE